MDLIFEKYNQDLHIAITATTRQPRTNEKNGINHYFKSETEFKDLINEKLLIEWAKVYDNFYGVPYSEIIDNLKVGCKGIIPATEMSDYFIKIYNLIEQKLILFQHYYY